MALLANRQSVSSQKDRVNAEYAFIEPFRFDFINYALIIALLVSVPHAPGCLFFSCTKVGLMGDTMNPCNVSWDCTGTDCGVAIRHRSFVAGLSCALRPDILKITAA